MTGVQTLALSDLGNGLPGLGSVAGKYLAEAGAVCLEENSHKIGVSLSLRGHGIVYQLHWSPIDEQIRRTHYDLQEATELGACGIAILLVLRRTEYTVIRRSRKGTGFDYWLGRKDDELFQEAARLEVSGILNGSDSQLDNRVKQKIQQVGASNNHLPAFVVVVEFGDPKSRVERK